MFRTDRHISTFPIFLCFLSFPFVFVPTGTTYSSLFSLFPFAFFLSFCPDRDNISVTSASPTSSFVPNGTTYSLIQKLVRPWANSFALSFKIQHSKFKIPFSSLSYSYDHSLYFPCILSDSIVYLPQIIR